MEIFSSSTLMLLTMDMINLGEMLAQQFPDISF